MKDDNIFSYSPEISCSHVCMTVWYIVLSPWVINDLSSLLFRLKSRKWTDEWDNLALAEDHRGPPFGGLLGVLAGELGGSGIRAETSKLILCSAAMVRGVEWSRPALGLDKIVFNIDRSWKPSRLLNWWAKREALQGICSPESSNWLMNDNIMYYTGGRGERKEAVLQCERSLHVHFQCSLLFSIDMFLQGGFNLLGSWVQVLHYTANTLNSSPFPGSPKVITTSSINDRIITYIHHVRGQIMFVRPSCPLSVSYFQ